MSIQDKATRRSLEAEFQRAFSPLEVTTRWQNYGDFVFEVQGLPEVSIERSSLSWARAMDRIATIRRDLQRDGVALEPWEPSPVPPSLPPTLS